MTLNQTRLALIAATSALIAACGGGDPQTEAPTEEPVTETASEPQETAEAAAEPDMLPAPEGSRAAEDMAIGSEDAPLTVVEYASVTCPGCAAFHARVFPRIKEELIDTGKVRFVYRELPTPPQRYAFAGFIVARCAATQPGPEAFFAMVDALYRRQQDWIRGENAAEELRNIAAQGGVTGEEFDNCFRREDIRQAIVGNVEEARGKGVTGTPTFLIDGKPFDLGFDPDAAVEKLQAEVEKRS